MISIEDPCEFEKLHQILLVCLLEGNKCILCNQLKIKHLPLTNGHDKIPVSTLIEEAFQDSTFHVQQNVTRQVNKKKLHQLVTDA